MEIELVECDDGKPYSRWCVDTAMVSAVEQMELTQAGDGRGVRPGRARNVLDHA